MGIIDIFKKNRADLERAKKEADESDKFNKEQNQRVKEHQERQRPMSIQEMLRKSKEMQKKYEQRK